jgi:hypothetical protein
MTAPTLAPRQLRFSCQHRWQLPPPNGTSVLSGRCAYCGQERVFKPFEESLKQRQSIALPKG